MSVWDFISHRELDSNKITTIAAGSFDGLRNLLFLFVSQFLLDHPDCLQGYE